MRNMMDGIGEKKATGLGTDQDILDWISKDGVRISEKELNQFIERMTGLSRQQLANQGRMV